jgi:hypothetical protein
VAKSEAEAGIEASAAAEPSDAPAAAYVVALASYVALGYVFRSVVLNWIVGPLFLVLVLYVAPRALTAAGRRLGIGADR